MTIGRKIIHLDAVDSTNNYAANLVKQKQIEHGTVILADDQYAGRGQRDAEWSVKPGENLTFSVFIDNVNLSVDRQFVLTQLVSLSLIRFLKHLGLPSTIKWPNDIYVNHKKIAGVLIENQLSGNVIKSSIIGIGLNVNQHEFDGFEATSLFTETGTRRIPRELLFSFIESFNTIWNEYFGNRGLLKKTYMSNLLNLDAEANYADVEGSFIGRILDVDETGKLIVERDGQKRTYDLKEIQFLFNRD